MHRLASVTLSLTLVLCVASIVRADPPGLWPAFRHDAQRTGRAPETAVISSGPTVAWTLPIGGNLSAAQSVVADLDGDGKNEVVLASAGGIVVRGADDSVRVRSALFGADLVFGVANLDGAGPPEIVAHGVSPRGVYVIDSATGNVLATLPVVDLRVGAVAVPRAGGGADLIVRDYAGSQGVLTLYGTSASLAAPATLWTAALADYDVDRSVGLADLDGDGVPEVIAPNDRGLSAFALATGALRWNAPTIPDASYTPAYYFQWVALNVDGMPGDEIVALDTSYYYSEDTGLSVLGLGSTGALHVLWQVFRHDDVTPGAGNDVGRTFFHVMADSVGDLDGDGSVELVYAEWDARAGAGSWTLYVVDAATGASITSASGQDLSAVADLDDDGRLEVVTRNATDANAVSAAATPLFATLRAYDFDARATGLHDQGWSHDNAAPVLLPSYRAAHGPFDLGWTSSGALSSCTHQDIDVGGSDPAEELYIYFDAMDEFRNQERPTDIIAIHGGDGVVRADYVIPVGTFATVVSLADSLTSAASRAEALVAVNDGLARVIDHGFVAVGQVSEGNFAQLPVVVSLDGTSTRIAVTDSTEDLRLIDGTQSVGAVPLVTARVRGVVQGWARGYVNAPGAVAALAGGNALMVHAHSQMNWQDQSLLAIDASGHERWRSEIGHGRSVSGFDNPEIADLDADGVPDVVTSEISAMGTEEIVVHSGLDGSVLRSLAVGPLLSASGITVSTGAYFQGHALADLNGDAVPDLVGALHPSWFAAIDLSATPIRPLWLAQSPSGVEGMVNGQAIVAPFAADGSARVLRVNSQNAFGPYTRLAFDGTIELQQPPMGVAPNLPETDMNVAAIITHAGAPARFDFVTTGMAGAAIGMVVRYDGVTMATTFARYLSGGAVSDTPPANAAQLYDPIVLDVDGDHTDDIVVGSDDGYLYALHGADGSLIWALPSTSPVVFVIAANLDMDPALELLCSRLDGTLVAIDAAGAYGWTPAPEPDAGVALDASGGMDGGASSADVGPDAQRVHPAPSSGCGCRAASADARGGVALASVLVVLALALRRRKR